MNLYLKWKLRWKFDLNPFRKFRTFKNAVSWCHGRSAIYLPFGKRYWKSHQLLLRVPWYLKIIPLWREHDPRDEDGGSLFMFND